MLKPTYVSSRSADALISDLRPTSLHPQALSLLNIFLDELLFLILSTTKSLDPEDIKTRGIPIVFSGAVGETEGATRSLGRDAVGEAEMELKSWKDGRKMGGGKDDAFERFKKGMREDWKILDGEDGFPVKEGVDLMRIRIMQQSTLASQQPQSNLDKQLLNTWFSAGGSTSAEILTPASLYITAIIERICEHILGDIARVVARDSGKTVAGVGELYTALCEDESVWGLLKRMDVKSTIEANLKSNPHNKTSSTDYTPSSTRITSTPTGGIRSSPVYNSDSHPPRTSTSSPISAKIRPTTPSKSSPKRRGHEQTNSNSIKASWGISSPGESDGRKSVSSVRDDEKSSKNEHGGAAAGEDDFERLIKSGQTMKVTLTPSRLRNFDPANGTSPISPMKTSPLTPEETNASPKHVLPIPTTEKVPSPAVITSPAPETPPKSQAQDNSHPKLVEPTSSVPRLLPKSSKEAEGGGGGKSSPKYQTPSTEGLLDLFNSDPPWASQAIKKNGPPVKTRSLDHNGVSESPIMGRDSFAPNFSLGEPIDIGTKNRSINRDRSPRVTDGGSSDGESPRGSRSPHAAGAGKTRPKTPAQELAEFFLSEPPPPPTNLGLYADLPNEQVPEPKSGRIKSFVSALRGKKASTSDLKKDYDHGQPSTGGLGGLLGRRKSQTQPPEPVRPRVIIGTPPSAFRSSPSYTESITNSNYTNPQVLRRASSQNQLRVEQHEQGAATAPSSPSGRAYTLPRKPVTPLLESDLPAVPGKLVAPTSTDRDVTSAKEKVDDKEREKPKQLPVLMADKRASVVLGSAAVAAASGLGVAAIQRKPEVAIFVPTKPPATARRDPDGETRPSSEFEYQSPATLVSKPVQDKVDVEPQHETSPVQETLIHLEESRPSSEVEYHSASSQLSPTPKSLQTGTAESATTNPTSPGVPQMALSELASLRSLLVHATSAAECRLLLTSLLNQWNVPQIADGEQDLYHASPDTKVVAWLLGGNMGPAGGAMGLREEIENSSVQSKPHPAETSEATLVDEVQAPVTGSTNGEDMPNKSQRELEVVDEVS